MNDANHSVEKLGEGFTRCPVTCPLCGHEHIQFRLSPNLYWSTDMEFDRKPSKYQCRQSAEGYHPPLYDLWQCPQCHFTAHNRIFPDPLKNVYIEKRIVQRRFVEVKQEKPEFERVVNTLGNIKIGYRLDFVDTIQMGLLAVYFHHFLLDVLEQNQLPLARAYLRLAWLFRDMNTMSDTLKADEKRVEVLFRRVKTDWPAIPQNEKEAMNAACEWFRKKLDVSPMDQDVQEAASTLLQIARIRILLGEEEEAIRLLNECRQLLTDEVNSTTRLLNEDFGASRMSEAERASLLTTSRKYRAMVGEAQLLQDDLRKKRQTSVDDEAKEILKKMANQSPDAMRMALQKAGIPDRLIRQLVPEKKKGLFGGFFGT